MGKFLIGLDLAQTHDFTALAVLERQELKGPWDAAEYAHRKMAALQLRHLERLARGTSYLEVVRRVAHLTRSGDLMGKCTLVVDGTGVGRPVVDLLRIANLDPQCWMLPVVITGGQSESNVEGYYHVPKRDLIIGLQVLFQRGGLQIANGMAFGGTLVEELSQMRVKQTASGHEQFGAGRSGEHDDLVLAVALAHWGMGKVCRPVDGDDGIWRYSAAGSERTYIDRR